MSDQLIELIAGNIGILATNLFVPVGLVVLNALVRKAAKRKMSFGSDAALFFVAFDITVLGDQASFVRLVCHPLIAANLGGFFQTFLVIALITWAYSALIVEAKLSTENRRAQVSKIRFGIFFLSSWLLIGAMLFLHVVSFTIRTNNG